MENEGKKRYNQKDGVGKSKYVISYHDGKKKHKDGSDFFDIQIFRNKKDLAKFVNTLHKGGYKYGFDESVNEASFRPNSGTKSGGTHGLDNRKYELKRDVKGVQIGDYTNITLPKGTIIYNIPGGVFAHHRSLRSYESGMNKYFNKPTFRGISVRREKNTILSIEKNSKILESVNEASIKGRNNRTGEAFGMVIGSDKKNREGDFEVTIRITYSARIHAYTFVFDKSSNLTAIKDYGSTLNGKFPDMSGSSVKSVRPNPRETITQIAKITSPAFAKKIHQHVKKVNESTDGVPQGYNPMVEDKKQIKDLVKKVKHEKLFYDVLDTMEKKYGKRKYRIWLEKSLKDFGVNPKQYDYRTNAGAEEKLFQLGK